MQASSTTIPPVDLPYLGEQERGFAVLRAMTAFRPTPMSADDGTPLSVYEAGEPSHPTVLLVNALGVPCLFLARLAAALARDRHVVTWESRGLPAHDALADGADLSVARHARDAAGILDRLGRRADAVVAYCAGANVAVMAIAEGLIAPRRLCIISPSMEIPGVAGRTDYQKTMLPIWRKVATSGPRHAALIRALILQNRKPLDGSELAELTWLNNLPFGSDATTQRYARMQVACLEPDWPALLARVGQPTLVLHGADDDIIHHDTSAAVAAGIPGAGFTVIPDGGHFAVFTAPSLHGRVAAFLREP